MRALEFEPKKEEKQKRIPMSMTSALNFYAREALGNDDAQVLG